jgi:hypothetical protein
MKLLDLQVLAAMAAGCGLRTYYKRGYGWSHAPWKTCDLIHPDGREKVVSFASKRRLHREDLIKVSSQSISAGEENYVYALTAEGAALAATCTKSLEEIFQQRKAATPVAATQETT